MTGLGGRKQKYLAIHSKLNRLYRNNLDATYRDYVYKRAHPSCLCIIGNRQKCLQLFYVSI